MPRAFAQKSPAPLKHSPPRVVPAAGIKAPQGFRVELLYSVPRATQGSWVNMTVDPKGRLIVSDQYGKPLPRHAARRSAARPRTINVEPIDVPIGEAHGLALGVRQPLRRRQPGPKYESGLYRVRDTNGDDRLDKVELLASDRRRRRARAARRCARARRPVALRRGRQRHASARALRLAGPSGLGRGQPAARACIDGRRLHDRRESPRRLHLPRQPRRQELGAGLRSASATRSTWPSTATASCSPTTPTWSGTSTRRGTAPRASVTSPAASEFGYRNGAGKWPAYTIDSLPPWSTSARARPRASSSATARSSRRSTSKPLFLCDWSYGKLYALHLKPEGATYTGELEEFVAGTPLALDRRRHQPERRGDVLRGRRAEHAVGPVPRDLRRRRTDGRGRAPPEASRRPRPVALRHKLEAFHGRTDPKAVDAAWPYLGHADRFIRWAARVAIEVQDPAIWRERALAESSSPAAALECACWP